MRESEGVWGAHHDPGSAGGREGRLLCTLPTSIFNIHRMLIVDLMWPQDPNVQCWGTEQEDDGDPPRLWAPNAMYPGTAFTRSLGDTGVGCTHTCK